MVVPLVEATRANQRQEKKESRTGHIGKPPGKEVSIRPGDGPPYLGWVSHFARDRAHSLAGDTPRQ